MITGDCNITNRPMRGSVEFRLFHRTSQRRRLLLRCCDCRFLPSYLFSRNASPVQYRPPRGAPVNLLVMCDRKTLCILRSNCTGVLDCPNLPTLSQQPRLVPPDAVQARRRTACRRPAAHSLLPLRLPARAAQCSPDDSGPIGRRVCGPPSEDSTSPVRCFGRAREPARRPVRGPDRNPDRARSGPSAMQATAWSGRPALSGRARNGSVPTWPGSAAARRASDRARLRLVRQRRLSE